MGVGRVFSEPVVSCGVSAAREEGGLGVYTREGTPEDGEGGDGEGGVGVGGVGCDGDVDEGAESVSEVST